LVGDKSDAAGFVSVINGLKAASPILGLPEMKTPRKI
jgi:hypothetical protein